MKFYRMMCEKEFEWLMQGGMVCGRGYKWRLSSSEGVCFFGEDAYIYPTLEAECIDNIVLNEKYKRRITPSEYYSAIDLSRSCYQVMVEFEAEPELFTPGLGLYKNRIHGMEDTYFVLTEYGIPNYNKFDIKPVHFTTFETTYVPAEPYLPMGRSYEWMDIGFYEKWKRRNSGIQYIPDKFYLWNRTEHALKEYGYNDEWNPKNYDRMKDDMVFWFPEEAF